MSSAVLISGESVSPASAAAGASVVGVLTDVGDLVVKAGDGVFPMSPAVRAATEPAPAVRQVLVCWRIIVLTAGASKREKP